MRIVRRKIWSRFWGLAALISLTSFAAALAWAAYDPSMSRGVRALGSFLERVPVRQAPRKAPAKPTAVRAPAVVAPVEIPPPVLPPPLPEAAAIPSSPPQAAIEDEAWDEEDELHSDEDEMPTAPSEEP